MECLPGYSRYQAGCAGPAYNEAAFRHFLDVDRRRAERSIRRMLLVLVSVRTERVGLATLTDATATAIFTSLGECVREIDFVGWYREGRVPAAVLVQANTAPIDVHRRMSDRIVQALRGHLPADVMRRVRVRAIRLGGTR